MAEQTGPEPEVLPETAPRRRPVLITISLIAGVVLCLALATLIVVLVARLVLPLSLIHI